MNGMFNPKKVKVPLQMFPHDWVDFPNIDGSQVSEFLGSGNRKGTDAGASIQQHSRTV